MVCMLSICILFGCDTNIIVSFYSQISNFASLHMGSVQYGLWASFVYYFHYVNFACRCLGYVHFLCYSFNISATFVIIIMLMSQAVKLYRYFYLFSNYFQCANCHYLSISTFNMFVIVTEDINESHLFTVVPYLP